MRMTVLAAFIAASVGCGMVGKSDAFKAYEKFMNALRSGNCGEMQALIEGEGTAKTLVTDLCTPKTMTVYGKTVNMGSAAGAINDMASTPAAMSRGFARKAESETKAGDEVTLIARESVRGRASAMNPLPNPQRQTVKLKKTGEGWKIVDFAEEEVKP